MAGRFLEGLYIVMLVVSLPIFIKGYRLDMTRRIPPVDNTQQLTPDGYLVKYGYLAPLPPDVQHSPQARRAAIRGFQRFAGLRATGRLDRPTRRLMRAPRCGNPDTAPAERAQGGPQRFRAPGRRWSKRRLTWRLLNASPDMSFDKQKQAFRNGLNYWSAVSRLSFEEKTSGDADIKIMFATGYHGDGFQNAFDRRGGVLAHAFYPEDGRAHFDDAELWSEGGGRASLATTDLQMVATHEFGHVLGLGHSSVRNAVMAPFYRGYDPNFRLKDDDIRGIRSLYGKEQGNRYPADPTTPPEDSASSDSDINVCNMTFDALFQARDGSIVVLHGDKLWRLNEWSLQPGYPVAIQSVYPRLPAGIEAAVYSTRTRSTYFFKGNYIFKYVRNRQSAQVYINGAPYPSSPRAAFQSRNGNIYVLKANNHWLFNETRISYAGRRRRNQNRWPGLRTANLDSAVVLRDGFLYAVTNRQYVKYDEFGRRSMPGYPRGKAGPFLGPTCGGRYIPK